MFKIILILSKILLLANGSALVFIDDSKKFLGDNCTLASGSEGICVKYKNCTTVSSLKNITKCEFEQDEIIICCEVEELTSFDYGYPSLDDNPIFPPSNLTLPRFYQTLCENHEPRTKFVPNIIAGAEADVREFPFQVALGYQINNTLEFNCGGSLILNDFVITAAHCVNYKDALPVMVRLGRVSLVDNEFDYGPVVDVPIKKIIIHKQNRRSTRENDIALIKLEKKVEFDDFIQPICISKDDNALGKNLTVTGFGITNIDTRTRSTWLMKGTVQEVLLDDCKTDYSIVNKMIVHTQICASGKTNTDACQGDSGGPLVLRENDQDRLYGITSHGNGCGSALPALYTRVDKYLDWIEKTINILDKIDS